MTIKHFSEAKIVIFHLPVKRVIGLLRNYLIPGNQTEKHVCMRVTLALIINESYPSPQRTKGEFTLEKESCTNINKMLICIHCLHTGAVE